MMGKKWVLRVGVDGGGDVMPLDDLIPHIRGQGCVCRPYLNEGWLSVHHAADAREHFEPDYESKYDEPHA